MMLRYFTLFLPVCAAVPQPWDLLESEWAEAIDATCQTCPSCPPSKWPCHFVCCDPRVTPTHKREACPDGSLCCECGNPAVCARVFFVPRSQRLARFVSPFFAHQCKYCAVPVQRRCPQAAAATATRCDQV